jgi:hypothetical protein
MCVALPDGGAENRPETALEERRELPSPPVTAGAGLDADGGCEAGTGAQTTV